MSSGAEALQKVFKTLSDPTRIRILRLLEQEELIVGELMDILGMAQSRVSRHLAILREARMLEISFILLLPVTISFPGFCFSIILKNICQFFKSFLNLFPL